MLDSAKIEGIYNMLNQTETNFKPVISKTKAFISSITLFILLYALCASILLSSLVFSFSLYKVINPFFLFVLIAGIVLATVLLNQKAKFAYSTKNILILIFITWIAIQALVVISIETDYNLVKEDYVTHYNLLRANQVNELDATWSIVEKFNQNYDNIYGDNESNLPSRNMFLNPAGIAYIFANPILGSYFFNIESLEQPDQGYYKLVIVQNSGACGEFASSIGLLVHDVTGFDTRVIDMEGKDHGFPEVKIDNKWWVLDKIFTTPLQPVESSTYADYMAGDVAFNSIHDLHESYKSGSLLKEHGFNSSNLTVFAVYDLTTQKAEDKPASKINIEIFALENSYDPLVDKGVTDQNGVYSTELRAEKEYLVFAQEQKFPKSSVIGFEKVYLSPNNDTTIVVYLHKYQ